MCACVYVCVRMYVCIYYVCIQYVCTCAQCWTAIVRIGCHAAVMNSTVVLCYSLEMRLRVSVVPRICHPEYVACERLVSVACYQLEDGYENSL